MDLFDIGFTTVDPIRTNGVGVGEIRIGSFRERFESDLLSWDVSAYERQWNVAATQIITLDKAAFVTTFAPQSSANFVRCWAMYRESDRLFVREQLLLLDRLRGPFDPHASGRYLEDRLLSSEDGEPISEWTTSVDAVKSFLSRRAEQRH